MKSNIPESAEAEHWRLFDDTRDMGAVVVDQRTPEEHLQSILEEQDYNDPTVEDLCMEIEHRVVDYPAAENRAGSLEAKLRAAEARIARLEGALRSVAQLEPGEVLVRGRRKAGPDLNGTVTVFVANHTCWLAEKDVIG